jgi:hypothetical protein
MADVRAYWWAIGSSGMVTPASAPTAGPQNPAQLTTMSALWKPLSVRTPVTAPPS